jgi:hypothetical protein
MTEQQRSFNPDQAAMDAVSRIQAIMALGKFGAQKSAQIQDIIADTIRASLSHAKGEAVGEITIDKHGDAHFRASLGYLDLDQGTYELYTHPAPQVAEEHIPVPRALVEHWANVDAFQAPKGAAMELKTIAQQMLANFDAKAPKTAPQVAVPEEAIAEVVIESDYWNRGHFHEGRKKEIRVLKGLRNIPVGTLLYFYPEPQVASLEECVQLDHYDAGILSGNDDSPTCWWHDYIRSELDAAHQFYQEQVNTIILPHAEEEAFGWFTEDHDTDKSATTYDPVVAERWRAKGWPVWPLYTHPAPSQQPVSDPDGKSKQAALQDEAGFTPQRLMESAPNGCWGQSEYVLRNYVDGILHSVDIGGHRFVLKQASPDPDEREHSND